MITHKNKMWIVSLVVVAVLVVVLVISAFGGNGYARMFPQVYEYFEFYSDVTSVAGAPLYDNVEKCEEEQKTGAYAFAFYNGLFNNDAENEYKYAYEEDGVVYLCHIIRKDGVYYKITYNTETDKDVVVVYPECIVEDSKAYLVDKHGNREYLFTHYTNTKQEEKSLYRYNSWLTTREIDLRVDTSMPNPNMSDADMLNDFYQPCRIEFDMAYGYLSQLVDQEDYTRWIEERAGLEVAHARLGEYLNVYAFIKDFGISYSDAYDLLVATEPPVFSASELKAICDGREDEVARYFASDYSIVVNGCIYSPHWLYLHTPDDYREVGITEKMVKNKLQYYSRLPLTLDAVAAFEAKLSEFLGEEVKFDLGLVEMYWGDIYDGIPEMYTYEFVENGFEHFLAIEKLDGLEYTICEKYEATATHEAAPDWGIEVCFGEMEKLYLYMSNSQSGHVLETGSQVLESVEINEAQLKIADAGNGHIYGEYKSGPGSFCGVWLSMSKNIWEENKNTIIRLIKSIKYK